MLRNYKKLFKKIIYQCAYQKQFKASIQDPVAFWKREAQKINWYTFPKTILNFSNPPFYRWYEDGEINITQLALDDNVVSIPNQVAFYWQSPVTNSSSSITYTELHQRVSRFAHSLSKDFKINKGDRVIIYMPMIIEASIAMLACARIGAIHSVVFGGFSAEELGHRIKDTEAKLIITSTAGKQPNKIIEYKPIVDQAIKISKISNIKTIIFKRQIHPQYEIKSNDFDFLQVQKSGQYISPLKLKSNDPLYILYTSGSTGTPKGILRDHGGTAVALKYSMDKILGMKKGQTFFSGSDIGWVVGHSFIIYGPLISSLKGIIFEGKPVGTPDAGILWRICQKLKVNHVYSAPTAIRSIRKQDPEGKFIKSHDLSSLQSVSFAGERCDIPTYQWLQVHLPGKFLNDNYWQTETGWPILSNFKNLETFKFKPGSATKPVPGYNLKIIDEQTKLEKQVNHNGLICIEEPTPPSFMLNLWKNQEGFVEKYFKTIPGYYLTGDSGYIDREGYYHVMSRIDDVINTAGHRLSTGQMEQIIMINQNIGQAVVIGIKDEIKGQIPIGFVTLKTNATVTDQKLIQKQIVSLIRKKIGPVASFKICVVVKRIPKTRSGKYLRHILRKMCHNQKFTIPPTIEDPTVLSEIQQVIKNHKLNESTGIQFEQHDE